MTFISVRQEDLRAAAEDLSEAAALIADGVRISCADAGAARQSGWLAEAELARAQTAWTAHLAGLRTAVATSALGLAAAADHYAAAEREAGEAWLRGGVSA